MDTKAWYLSRGMWGGLIAGAATLLQITGVANVSETDQQALIEIVLTGGQLVGDRRMGELRLAGACCCHYRIPGGFAGV